MARKSQMSFLKKGTDRYGGSLLTTRKGREVGRPLSTRHSMHFVLRSTKAKGDWSFTRHKKAIGAILEKFANKHGIVIDSVANVGNHLHLHLKIMNRQAYKPFIRAITSAIMMAVTGMSRWADASVKARLNAGSAVKGSGKEDAKTRFWDQRPFSRIVVGFKAAITLRDYIMINRFEGLGYDRGESTFLMRLNTGKLNSS